METMTSRPSGELTSGHEPDGHPIRFGFGGRLLAAFGIVAVMTIAAGLVAWLGFAALSNAIDRIQVQHLPSITVAAEFAEKGGAIMSTAPQLIVARTENRRVQVWSELRTLLQQMRQLTREAPAIDHQQETGARLRHLISEIDDNLVALDDQVRQRFVLEELLADLTDRLRWVHTDFLDEIEPMVDDARFNLASAMERIEAARDSAEIKRYLAILHEETKRQEAMLKINASGNLAVGLLVRGSSAPDDQTLDDTIHFHGEVAARLQNDLTHLADEIGRAHV